MKASKKIKKSHRISVSVGCVQTLREYARERATMDDRADDAMLARQWLKNKGYR